MQIESLKVFCDLAETESFTKAGFDPSRVQRLAIVDGNNPTFKAETRQTLVDTAQMEFLRAGWSLVERENIQKAIDEMNFQNSDITAPDQRQAHQQEDAADGGKEPGVDGERMAPGGSQNGRMTAHDHDAIVIGAGLARGYLGRPVQGQRRRFPRHARAQERDKEFAQNT